MSESRPRVLVFSEWFAPGYLAGGPVRSLVNMVSGLGDQVDFHIVTRDQDIDGTRYTEMPRNQWIERDQARVPVPTERPAALGSLPFDCEAGVAGSHLRQRALFN